MDSRPRFPSPPSAVRPVAPRRAVLALALAAGLAIPGASGETEERSASTRAAPGDGQSQLQDLELGVTFRLPEGGDLSGPVAEWVQAARAAGAGYVVLAVPAADEAPSEGAVFDLVRRFEAAVGTAGLRLGLELAGSALPRADRSSRGASGRGRARKLLRLLEEPASLVQVRFRSVLERAAIDWKAFVEATRAVAPDAVLHEWGAPGSYEAGANAPWPCFYKRRAAEVLPDTAAEQVRGDAPDWLIPICTVELRADATTGPSDAELVRAYYRSVGRGAGLVFDVELEKNGRLGERSAELLAGFGAELRRRFGEPIARAEGSGVELEAAPVIPKEIDHVVLRENLADGQRVLRYVVEGDDGGGWHPIGGGESVGNRRVHWFEPTRIERVRVRVLESDGDPRWRELSLHAVANARGVGELYRQVKTRLQTEGNADEALRDLETMTRRLAAFGPFHLLRAVLLEREGSLTGALTELNVVLDLEPTLQSLYHLRAGIHFRLERFEASVRDYDLWLRERGPRASDACWQRGLACYYAGDYAAGQRQFEGYHRVGALDIENGIWRLLCMAEQVGIEKARDDVLEYSERVRAPFPALLDLYLGRGTIDAVLQQAREDANAPELLNENLFYAHYYAAKYLELIGEVRQALDHVEVALTHRIDHFMYDCCRIDAKRIRARLRDDAAADEGAQ